MKLVVGLGNPGDEYKNTRHNIGFLFLDSIVAKFKFNSKFNAMEAIDYVNNEKIVYVKPYSYMNLSGEVVQKYMNFYKIMSTDLLVIQDDLDMPSFNKKILFNHGDGGHNGIKNIINNIGTKEFYRLKIGISKNTEIDTKDYVLGSFSSNDLKNLNNLLISLKDIVFDFVNLNSSDFIQKYNTKE